MAEYSKTDDGRTHHISQQRLPKSKPTSSSLEVNLFDLERQSLPQKFTVLSEVAKFSTTDQDKDASTASRMRKQGVPGSYFAEYGVHGNYRRSLHKNPTANLMQVWDPMKLNEKMDLRRGSGTQIGCAKDNEFLSLLLECLVDNGLVGKSEFVCLRRLLTDIGMAPYEAGGRFDLGTKIAVQKVGGVFYMFGFPSEDSLLRIATLSDSQKVLDYGGMKFESYVTAKPGCAPTPHEILNYNLQFCSVLSATLGSHSLLYRGEMDGCFSNDPKRYVELKTSRDFDHAGQERSFRRFKLIRWWLQTHLVGIEDILCGFRNDESIVTRCEWFKVENIPEIMKQDPGHCKPAICLTFINEFLDFVKETVQTELEPFIFTRRSGAKVFEVRRDQERKYKFLPLWYINQVMGQAPAGGNSTSSKYFDDDYDD